MILYISNVLTLTSRVVGVCVRVRVCVCLCLFCDHKTRGGSVGASGLGSGKMPHDTSLRPLCRCLEGIIKSQIISFHGLSKEFGEKGASEVFMSILFQKLKYETFAFPTLVKEENLLTVPHNYPIQSLGTCL